MTRLLVSENTLDRAPQSSYCRSHTRCRSPAGPHGRSQFLLSQHENKGAEADISGKRKTRRDELLFARQRFSSRAIISGLEVPSIKGTCKIYLRPRIRRASSGVTILPHTRHLLESAAIFPPDCSIPSHPTLFFWFDPGPARTIVQRRKWRQHRRVQKSVPMQATPSGELWNMTLQNDSETVLN
jgi:hypothetical protein